MIRRFPALILALAALFAICPAIARAAPAYNSANDFAPANIADLMNRWKPRCVVRVTCPVSDELHDHVKGAITADSFSQVPTVLAP
jgi:hypothetical protein